MFIIELRVNEKVLKKIKVNRLEKFDGKDEIYNYYIWDSGGKTVKHRYSQGPVKLALKVLKAVQDE